MRFRTLALALALSFGAASLVQAAPGKTSVHRVKRQKLKKVKPDKRFKQSKASRVKPRKARKVKHA